MIPRYNIKTLGSQAAHLVAMLQERRRLVFTLPEVEAITGLQAPSARSFVRGLVTRGVAARLKPGLFNLVPFELGREKEYLGNPYVIARELMGGRRYYISHASAMEIHQMTTQPQLVVYVTSPKAARAQRILGAEFRFVRCSPALFFGFAERWVDKEQKVLVSDIERTVLDGLRAPKYCGGITEVAKGLGLRRGDIDVKKLLEYASRLGIGSVLGRLGFLLEVLEAAPPSDLEPLRRRLGRAYVLLDPMLPAEGKFLAKWRLRVNVTADEILGALHT